MNKPRYLIIISDGTRVSGFLQTSYAYWKNHPNVISIFEIPDGVRLMFPEKLSPEPDKSLAQNEYAQISLNDLIVLKTVLEFQSAPTQSGAVHIGDAGALCYAKALIEREILNIKENSHG